MRIFILPSSVHCLNLGDVAMMQVTYRRLSEFWPDSEIHILNNAPDLLKLYCPKAKPVPTLGQSAYYATPSYLTRMAKRFARPALSEFDVIWRHGSPALAETVVKVRNGEKTASSVRSFLELVRGCDLVMASGAGQITTAFSGACTPLLNTLELAQKDGVLTAIMGQGIGPIDEPCLRARAAKVLPKVDLICVRETLTGPPLLESLGVPRDRIVVTGDDAIETVYQNRQNALGQCIGVNLRVSWYSDIPGDWTAALCHPLQEAAREVCAPLISIPISRHPEEDDSGVCMRLFEGYPSVAEPMNDLTLVEGMVREVGRCRVMLTTSYHGGVFALAQGIPVVAWLKSKYFAAKLYGLANQFGVGCDVITLEEADWEARLKSAILSAWDSAEVARPRLLAAASSQLAASQNAYERLRAIIAPTISRELAYADR